jgi:photoactive yellow protein
MSNLEQNIHVYDPKQLNTLSKEQLDALPFGTVRINADGMILFYSRAHAAITRRDGTAVLGRNFFTDVAPCTIVPEFYGRFRHGVLTGHLNTSFNFVFDFEMDPVEVRITMQSADCEDEFWIIVEPLQQLQSHDRHAAERLITTKYDQSSVTLLATSFDFSQCDQEPITTCATIQPFGALLVLNETTLQVDACSANIETYLGLTTAAVLNQSLLSLLPAADDGLAQALQQTTKKQVALLPAIYYLTWPDRELPLAVRINRWRQRILLELELHGDMPMDHQLRRFDVAHFQRCLANEHEITKLCQFTVDIFRHLSGFARVIVYQFEANYDGVVIAESQATDHWPSILGLRYPATDIPRQARALYCEIPLRYAPSRDHAEIPLLSHSVDPTTLDIGAAQLRAQSPIHRNYLKCFGVNGSMSISIMHQQHLWGLIIFHCHTPHPVTPYVRNRLAELTNCLAGRISLIEERKIKLAREQGAKAINTIVGKIDIEQPFPEIFLNKDHLFTGLIEADWLQLYHHDQPIFIHQDCHLNAEQIQALLAFLHDRQEAIWYTDCLSAEFEPVAPHPEHLAGLLSIFIDEHREFLLLFGRKRVRYTVNWGAEPSSLPFVDVTTSRPFGWPTRVFQRWQEQRTHHARSWTLTEIATAEALKNLIQQIIVSHAQHFERLAQSLATQRDHLQQSQNELQHRALHDVLTGLPNRAYFRDRLDELIKNNIENKQTFGVALLDIDHFKTINDTLGHDKGDHLLCAVTTCISKTLPEQALLARLGGDEFAILLPAMGEWLAFDTLQHMVQMLRQPLLIADDHFLITVSVGLTICSDHCDASDLLKQADLALYQVKETGRNNVCLFDNSLKIQAQQRLNIDRTILSTSPLLSIEIVLQQQHALHCVKAPYRFEALARWRTKTNQLLMPEVFVPAAERNGVIRSVTQAVIHHVIKILQQHLATNGQQLTMTVNVTASDLESATFSQQLIEDLHNADIPPDLLEVEIKAANLTYLTATIRASLQQLARAGINLALDDFGSHSINLPLLRELPFTIIKLDQALIVDLDQPNHYQFIHGIITLAHALQKIVIAKGVETPAQQAQLQALNCDWGQGFFWSQPLAPAQLLAQFATQ